MPNDHCFSEKVCKEFSRQWRYVYSLGKRGREMEEHEHESGIVEPRFEIKHV